MFKLRITETDKEEWKEHPFLKGYEMSTYGRIRSNLDYFNPGHILKGDLSSGGKIRYQISTPTITRKYMGHILIAQAFPEICGEWFEGCVVHHLDRNPQNNCARNLMVLSNESHIKVHNDSLQRKEFGKRMKAYWEGKRGKYNHKSKGVIGIDANGNEHYYESVLLACDAVKKTIGTLVPALKNPETRTAAGMKWRYA